MDERWFVISSSRSSSNSQLTPDNFSHHHGIPRFGMIMRHLCLYSPPLISLHHRCKYVRVLVFAEPNIIPQVQQNFNPSARLLHLCNLYRTGIPDCSVGPNRLIQEGLIDLKEWALDSIYALTRRHRIVTGFFITLATVQTTFGIVFLTSPSNTSEPSPNPPSAY